MDFSFKDPLFDVSPNRLLFCEECKKAYSGPVLTYDGEEVKHKRMCPKCTKKAGIITSYTYNVPRLEE